MSQILWQLEANYFFFPNPNQLQLFLNTCSNHATPVLQFDLKTINHFQIKGRFGFKNYGSKSRSKLTLVCAFFLGSQSPCHSQSTRFGDSQALVIETNTLLCKEPSPLQPDHS